MMLKKTRVQQNIFSSRLPDTQPTNYAASPIISLPVVAPPDISLCVPHFGGCTACKWAILFAGFFWVDRMELIAVLCWWLAYILQVMYHSNRVSLCELSARRYWTKRPFMFCVPWIILLFTFWQTRVIHCVRSDRNRPYFACGIACHDNRLWTLMRSAMAVRHPASHPSSYAGTTTAPKTFGYLSNTGKVGKPGKVS